MRSVSGETSDRTPASQLPMSSGSGTSGAARLGSIALGHSSNEFGLPRSEPLRDPSCQWIDGNASRRCGTEPCRPPTVGAYEVSNLVSFQPSIDIFPVIQAAATDSHPRNFRGNLPIERPKRDSTIPRGFVPCQQRRI